MVAKLIGPDAWPAAALSRETGVSEASLSRWRKKAILGDMTKTTKDGEQQVARRRRWTPERKVELVMRARDVREDELGALLRREGLHEEDLERFRQEVMQAATEGLRTKKRTRKLHPAEKEVKRLKKELARKERALAETAALLVLRGKVQAFLAADEEGDTTDESEQ
jgi:transposase-like protein